MDDLKKNIGEITAFFSRDIWKIRLKDLPAAKAFLIRQLRTAVLATEGFVRDNCPMWASSLTFYSLLSVVPVVALAFGIAKGFGFQKRLEKQLLDQIPGQEQVLLQIVESANRFLDSTQGGLIAGIGLVVLFWSVIKVLSHIEHSFNEIWKINTPRALGRKFADYLAIMLIGPILVIISSSATVYITTQITEITQNVALLGKFSPLIFSLLKRLPYVLIWVVFTMMYMLMPNTKVRFIPGLLAGVIAGTTYQIAQWGYISFQVGVARYNAIYGSFAALPLFLIWLQLSWMIVLMGAEISYASQNSDNYEFKRAGEAISLQFKQVLSLLVARLIVINFYRGNPLMTALDIARSLTLPTQLVRQILDDLVDSGVFSRTLSANPDTATYQPAVDTGLLTVHYVLDALGKNGIDDIPVGRTRAYEAVSNIQRSFHETLKNTPANKMLRDI